MANLSQTLPKAWTLFAKNKKLLVLAVLIELLFVFSLVYVHYTFFLPTTDAALKAGKVMQEALTDLPESEVYQLDSLLADNPEFMASYYVLLENILYFLLSCLLLGIVFKGLLWWLANGCVKKTDLRKYWLKFAGLSVFWFFMFMLALLLYGWLTGGSATILPVTSSTTASVLFIVLLAVILYFAQVSFALAAESNTFKNTFLLGIQKRRVLVFTVNLLVTFVALTLPLNWLTTLPLLSLAIAILISFPALHFARIHMVVAWNDKNLRRTAY
ncbi:hypothetical protein HY489_00825 [Candidatus Woesearchaeota archaeon]|nr:hypothetical protein [Candidatus Woesearchaeota archaeon]